MEDLTLVAVVAVALFFDFTNGFHDAANAIATSVSTRAVSPRLAVLGAAVLNFAGAFVSLEVAATVAKGVVNAEVATLEVVLGGVVGIGGADPQPDEAAPDEVEVIRDHAPQPGVALRALGAAEPGQREERGPHHGGYLRTFAG